jgi:integrase
MIEDMTLRNLSPHTIDAYVLAVKQFANHFKRSPDQLSGEQARQYLLHLVQERKVSWSRYNIARCGLQFFYSITLGRDEHLEKLPCARVPKRLPTVLSCEELRRLFEVARDVKHKALLMTLYGAGLRISEALALKPADIDSQRMLIHVRLGKGAKDRMVKLSGQLLAVLREYWRARRPRSWLFPQAKNSPSRRHHQARQPAHAAAQLRDAPAGCRHRPANHPASAGTSQPQDHFAVHARLAGEAERRRQPA